MRIVKHVVVKHVRFIIILCGDGGVGGGTHCGQAKAEGGFLIIIDLAEGEGEAKA